MKRIKQTIPFLALFASVFFFTPKVAEAACQETGWEDWFCSTTGCSEQGFDRCKPKTE